MPWQGEEPTAQTCPTVVLPPEIPLTVQAKEEPLTPFSVTESVMRRFAASVAVVGEMPMLGPGCMEMVACVFFEASACGVTVMTTVLGCGGAGGAV